MSKVRVEASEEHAWEEEAKEEDEAVEVVEVAAARRKGAFWQQQPLSKGPGKRMGRGLRGRSQEGGSIWRNQSKPIQQILTYLFLL